MKKEKIINIILISLLILFTIGNVEPRFQNDTFFDIPIGKYILENGIDMMDHFTWHTNLTYTYSHWLFGIVEAVLYDAFGFVGIYVMVLLIASITSITIFIILNKMGNNKILSFFITILAVYIGAHAFAARAQIITFLLFIIEFYCIEKLVETNKNRYSIIVIIISIIIANIHASVWIISFIFYLPYIAEIIIWFVLNKLKMIKQDSKIIIQKRNIKKLVITMVITFFTGMVTPLGNVPYMFMYNNITGLSSEYIQELQSMKLIENYSILFLISMYIGILAFTKTKLKLTDGIYVLGFTLMSLEVVRSVFYLIFIGAIILTRLLTECFKQYNVKIFERIEKEILNKKRNAMFFTFIIVSISLYGIFKQMPKEFVDVTQYPVEATQYILENVDINNMRIYNGFNYGSYLELKGIPAFMDSRSEVYCEEFNDTTVLKDVMKLESGIVSYKDIFNKYDITHVLVPTTYIVNVYIEYDEEYKILYQDDAFVLYERIK